MKMMVQTRSGVWIDCGLKVDYRYQLKQNNNNHDCNDDDAENDYGDDDDESDRKKGIIFFISSLHSVFVIF